MAQDRPEWLVDLLFSTIKGISGLKLRQELQAMEKPWIRPRFVGVPQAAHAWECVCFVTHRVPRKAKQTR